MAHLPIDIMDFRQLLQLHQQGISNRKAADFLQINRKTADKYIEFVHSNNLDVAELLTLSDKDLIELLPVKSELHNDRYEELAALFETISDELTKPGCTLQTLWRSYKEQHPDGYQYTQFTVHYRQWLESYNASGKLLHKAGYRLFVDYTGKKLHYVDRQTGEQVPVEVFVGILPCSQYTFVEASPDQKRESFIGSMNRCLHFFGGAPQAIVSDNLKAAVTKAHKHEPVINRTFKDFALHYQTVIDPTRPYHPQDKALVEGAVKLVYQRIFYPLSHQTFFSLEELNEAIKEKLEGYNNYLMQREQVSRKKRFEELEKQQLKPLPASPYLVRHYKRAKVQKMGCIWFSEDKNYYSVPHRYVGKEVQVQYNSDTVEVFYNRERLCAHKRSYKAGHYSIIQEHLSSTHRAYSEWNLTFFQQKAERIGPATAQYITQLIDQYTYPELGYKQAMGICHFIKLYDKSRVDQACERALTAHRYSYRVIENILKNGLDQLPLDVDQTPHIAPHSNIRGASSYQ